ncbi:MAG: GNAT family N-acetyltransferase [Xanthomonadales bacterium]|nr:GNAT family N-acetyltransferase [Xanthomonadales bacterium]
MEVIRANLDHLEPLSDLYDQYRQFYAKAPDREACRRFIGQRLKNGESVVFTARNNDGELLGFTQLYLSFCSVEMAELVYLYDLYVAPSARRQGVARALMEAARQFAEDRGAGALKLETAIDNRPAQALYEDLGWQRDEEFYTYHLGLKSGR